MPQPHLDPISLASLIGAGALALSRLLTTLKPVWDRLPALLQGLVPVLVLVLPQIAAAAAGVHTSIDLVNLIALSVALVLPGIHSHTVAIVKPSGPSSGALVGLVFAASLTLPVGCATLKSIWTDPAVLQCTDPVDAELLQEVLAVLKGNEDVSTALAALVHGDVTREVVECVVQQVVGGLQVSPRTDSDPQLQYARQRGETFLASIGKH